VAGLPNEGLNITHSCDVQEWVFCLYFKRREKDVIASWGRPQSITKDKNNPNKESWLYIKTDLSGTHRINIGFEDGIVY